MSNVRARGVTKDGKPIFNEDIEHLTVAHWLTLRGVNFIHVPNEGKRSWATGKKLKRMGMTKGVADFIIFDLPPLVEDRIGALLELKALDAPLSAFRIEQKAWMALLEDRWLGYCAWGSDAAIKWLESLGY